MTTEINIFIKRNAPDNLVRSAMVWCPELTELDGCIIAGGFIRAYFAGEKPADLDLYFRTEADYTDALDIMEQNNWEIVFKSDRAVSYRKGKYKIQIIGYYHGDPEIIITWASGVSGPGLFDQVWDNRYTLTYS